MLPVRELVEVDEGAYLHNYCAHSWLALANYMRDQFNIKLLVTDGYRPINRQERFFFSRYTTDISRAARTTSGAPADIKWYRGETWYILPGQALAAAPGTSNHGWGFAVDVAVTDGAGYVRDVNNDELRILSDEVHKFGWIWEVTSEPWHLTYILTHPWPAVFLPPPPPPPPPPQQPEEEDDMKAFQLVDTDGTVYLFIPGQESISLGGLPHVHSLMHNTGLAPLVNPGDPMPTDQLQAFSTRWNG
jgi:hypothetical protein